MTVTWFSDGQPSYNTMVDIDTNMFNHVSTLFTIAGINTTINHYEEYIFYLFNINKNIRTTRKIVSYHTILITGLSLVRKTNILL